MLQFEGDIIKLDDIPISSISIGDQRLNSLDRDNVFMTDFSFLLEQKCCILADCCLGIPPYSFSIVSSLTFPWNILRCPGSL